MPKGTEAPISANEANFPQAVSADILTRTGLQYGKDSGAHQVPVDHPRDFRGKRLLSVLFLVLQLSFACV